MRNATHGSFSNTYNRSKPSGELRGYKTCSKCHGQVKKGVTIRSLPQLVTNDALKREKGLCHVVEEENSELLHLGSSLLKLDELPTSLSLILT